MRRLKCVLGADCREVLALESTATIDVVFTDHVGYGHQQSGVSGLVSNNNISTQLVPAAPDLQSVEFRQDAVTNTYEACQTRDASRDR